MSLGGSQGRALLDRLLLARPADRRDGVFGGPDVGDGVVGVVLVAAVALEGIDEAGIRPFDLGEFAAVLDFLDFGPRGMSALADPAGLGRDEVMVKLPVALSLAAFPSLAR